MKIFITFLMSAIMVSTTMVPMAVSDDDMLRPPAKYYNERTEPLNNYYIGIHRPDGGCATVEVFAKTYDEAIKIVKNDRCDFCALDDLTSYYKSPNADEIAQANKTCPMR